MPASLKEQCNHDLSFPLHTQESGPARLAAIQFFMEQNGFDKELFTSGDAANLLQKKVAELFGKAAALWFPTGTMAQAVAGRIYAEHAGHNTIQLHPTSHLLLHEADGYEVAHNLQAEIYGSWASTVSHEQLNPDAAGIFIELPQRHNGSLLPTWEELNAVKKKAKECNLPLHMDGARIWACRDYYQNRSYAEIAEGFSSIYVSLYKDIGAIGGAVLIGGKGFIKEAEIWQHRLGGLMIEPWPMICDALRLLDTRLQQMPEFIQQAKAMVTALQDIPNLKISPNEPHTNMFHINLPCSAEKAEAARDKAATETGVWLGNRFWEYEGPNKCSLEITVGEKALALEIDAFKKAVTAMVAAL
ncbi:threonine aldolase family protein [Kordiimonas laminariae]|uniref:threonine aldolase family protein n=1 Tax=Kordiimonas laminariae TaxID=2917717 RepID=UPI001FF59760|nr:beta-eliminating lyase-related protein [Kordiimonas laminariae]MCK0070945.1 beta-eliminating lyase-related protein [Kordiimonas laminariae]